MNKKHQYYVLSVIGIFSVGVFMLYDTDTKLPSQDKNALITQQLMAEPTVMEEHNQDSNDIAPPPDNLEFLITEQEAPLADRFVKEADADSALYRSTTSLAANYDINLLTGSDLWLYAPRLKSLVESEQEIFFEEDTNFMLVDDNLLSTLAVGDSLLISLPNASEQQIVIGSIQKKGENITEWGLHNSQRQAIGKITQINNITEGSFISDRQEEYHLRTVNNKGWIANKNQLIKNNNQAVKRNEQPFVDYLLKN